MTRSTDLEVARVDSLFLPRQVLLFSGHGVDFPERSKPRFSADKVPAAAQRIAEALDEIGAGQGDLALSQAAAGGDLLFLDACLQRSVRCQVLLPLGELEFVSNSVLVHGTQWRDQYFEMKASLSDPILLMPDELGPTAKEDNPYARCNLRMLDSALRWGAERVHFICIWDGSGGDGPGGVAYMLDYVRRHGGQVTWIDARTL
jgi:hypothetical protein